MEARIKLKNKVFTKVEVLTKEGRKTQAYKKWGMNLILVKYFL